METQNQGSNPYDSQQSAGQPLLTEEQSPVLVILLTVITCGLYLIYWYYVVYQDLELLYGRTPTGNSFVLDLLLTIITVGLWGVYVDYQISVLCNELQQRYQMPPNDTTLLSIILDLSAYVTAFATNLVTSVIHQEQLNRIKRAARQAKK
ncbi:MAG: DUF4234 domain-containing protein [Leptospiraceae bacterium]|nr:DUF4234 domain-containing protein [Leptospiraceae bacterium]